MVSLIAIFHALGLNLQARLSREQTGATAVEYALLVGLIAVVLVGALIILGPQLGNLFTSVTDAITTTGH